MGMLLADGDKPCVILAVPDGTDADEVAVKVVLDHAGAKCTLLVMLF